MEDTDRTTIKEELRVEFFRIIENDFPELKGEEFRVVRYLLATLLSEKAIEKLT